MESRRKERFRVIVRIKFGRRNVNVKVCVEKSQREFPLHFYNLRVFIRVFKFSIHRKEKNLVDPDLRVEVEVEVEKPTNKGLIEIEAESTLIDQ